MENLSSYHFIVHFAVLAIMLIVYQFVYRYRNGFIFNRIYLFVSLLLSLVIPFLAFGVFPQYIEWITPELNLQNAVSSGQLVEDSSWSLFAMVYASIAILCAIVCTIQQIRLLQKMRRYHTEALHGKYTGAPMSYFSWMALPDINDNIIRAHEQHHIDAMHSMDRVVLTYIHCLIWWNPLLFWMHKLLVENHEMAADQASILQNKLSPIEYLEYMQNYLRHNSHNNRLSLANTYFIHLLKIEQL